MTKACRKLRKVPKKWAETAQSRQDEIIRFYPIDQALKYKHKQAVFATRLNPQAPDSSPGQGPKHAMGQSSDWPFLFFVARNARLRVERDPVFFHQAIKRHA